MPRLEHFFAISLMLLASIAHAETLGTILTAHKVPTQSLPAQTLQTPIHTYALSDNNKPFLLAYHLDDNNGDRSNNLGLVRYDATTNNLRQTILHDLDGPCTDGDLLDISERDGFIAINTHNNPSLGCLLIIDSDLTLRNQLYGGLLARVSGGFLYEQSETHWFATHPLRLSVYDPHLNRTTKIYPQPNDPARLQFSAQLRQHLPSPAWCKANANLCDTEDFTGNLGTFSVNPTNDTFKFQATMSADGFGENVDQLIPDTTIEYTFKLTAGIWRQTSQHQVPTPHPAP
jgi:hypothetical protein